MTRRSKRRGESCARLRAGPARRSSSASIRPRNSRAPTAKAARRSPPICAPLGFDREPLAIRLHHPHRHFSRNCSTTAASRIWRRGATICAPCPLFRFDSVIEEPAQRYGVRVDPTLVDAVIEDAPKEDALPLLAFGLQRLWRQYAASGALVLDNYTGSAA